MAVEVRLESEPKIQFEHASLVWYGDDDNYAGLFVEALGGKTKLQMVVEAAGKPQFAVACGDAKSVWLRLVIVGDEITGQFRESVKTEWQPVGRMKLPAAPKFRAGLTSGGGGKGGEREVRFSEFRILRVEK